MWGRSIFWTRAEEARLVELGRTSRAIEMKLTRLGVVEVERKISSTTTAAKSRDLFTHEETLRLLAGALDALQEPGQMKLNK